MELEPKTLLYALMGGILPAVLWLWFWLKEDSRKPEPRGLILLAFIAGMIGVVIVLPMERFAFNFFPDGSITLLTIWAAIEELVKFGAMSIIVFKSRFFDEPIDAMIYMITVALGFAALENSLFLLGPLMNGEAIVSFLTGNLRYIGATLLHVGASASIGIAMGLSFYKDKFIKTISIIIGVIVAIVLHTLFNFSIMNSNGENTFIVLFFLWLVIIVVIFFFEKVRLIRAKKIN